jgi:hypothetical protein
MPPDPPAKAPRAVVIADDDGRGHLRAEPEDLWIPPGDLRVSTFVIALNAPPDDPVNTRTSEP